MGRSTLQYSLHRSDNGGLTSWSTESHKSRVYPRNQRNNFTAENAEARISCATGVVTYYARHMLFNVLRGTLAMVSWGSLISSESSRCLLNFSLCPLGPLC
jgi:hypothetical protein